MYRLKKTGYAAYLVGGCVRDLLLGCKPKDFDVVTDASPEEVRKVFTHCRLIGRRFRLAHVHFGREIIEVATFRGQDKGDKSDHRVHKDGRLLRDNVFGAIEDDVWRRDFTVNALYYNIRDFSVRDYTGGMEDLYSGTLRLIGDPVIRYKEDPVRTLRAVRFSVKLDFKLDATCKKALFELASTLSDIPPARLYDEALKLFLSGKAFKTFEMLRYYGLFAILFPQTEQCLMQEQNKPFRLLIEKALKNSDKRIAQGKIITPYFFLSVFLWEAVQKEAKKNSAQGDNKSMAYQNAASTVISKQAKSLMLPKRITQAMREVWLLQLPFNRIIGSKPFKIMALPRFRAAYDFLLLRAEIGEVDNELARWWTKFQIVSNSEQKKMTQPMTKHQDGKHQSKTPKQSNNFNQQHD